MVRSEGLYKLIGDCCEPPTEVGGIPRGWDLVMKTSPLRAGRFSDLHVMRYIPSSDGVIIYT